MNKNYFTENLNQSHQKTENHFHCFKNLTLQLPLQKASSNHQNPETFTPLRPWYRWQELTLDAKIREAFGLRHGRRPGNPGPERPGPGSFVRWVLGGVFEPKRLTQKKMGSRSPVVCCEKTLPKLTLEKDTYLELPKGAKVLLKSIQHPWKVNWHTLEGAGIQKKTCFLCNPTGSLSTEPLSYEGYRWI